MLDIYQEFENLVNALNRMPIDYAIIGGLAMAVYGFPRATEDIDLLAEESAMDRFREIARGLGYTVEALPMNFLNGKIRIRRFSKIDIDTGDTLSLDIMLVTPEIQEFFVEREEYEWQGKKLYVLSRHGMIELKKLRGSGIDRDDIAKLGGK
jgi:hypothetical protein